jgi:hypothetical protein
VAGVRWGLSTVGRAAACVPMACLMSSIYCLTSLILPRVWAVSKWFKLRTPILVHLDFDNPIQNSIFAIRFRETRKRNHG